MAVRIQITAVVSPIFFSKKTAKIIKCDEMCILGKSAALLLFEKCGLYSN